MIINFTSATANKINIEDYSCWKQSLFQEAYSKAKRCLNEIVCADIELREKVTGDKDPFSRLYEENNKTIAFVGDRGSGKTSAMVSFVKACTENKIALFKSELPVNCNFFSLPVIEPSKLAEGESIVGFVVSQIYSDLEKSLERDREKIPRPLLENIVSDCTDLREALRVQGMTTVELLRQNTDELAHLRLLSQTKRLTEKLGDLVQNYLELRASVYRNGAVYPTKFLIIPIDDLDTSIPNAYRQIEELRNYLMLPGIIVTLALKIEQLSDALEQQHINALKDLFHHKLIADAQPAEMAAKYIQKVIPDQRRVELPSFDLNVLPDCTVIIDTSGKPEGLFECFADLVRRKLGIIMIPDERLSHPLIPHNLRALHQAILMLQEMKEIDDDGQKGENGKATALLQLQKFESWIIELLYASTLNETLIEILRKFVSHSDRNLAAFLWRSLETYLSGKITAVEVSALLQRNISNENISIGNVLHLLTTLHKTEVEDDFTLVGAVVRMLYSIRIRRQMLRSLEVNESVTLKQSLKLMPELGFERVWTIFNGLVYDTQERLTYDGFENMPNADASTGKVCYQTSRRVISLTGDEESAPAGPIDSDENMSVEEAVWCSFFVVCFGRVAQEDVHSLKTSVLYSIMEPHTQRIAGALETGSSGPSFVYANWMAFVHNILRPRYTSHRLLWQTELSATNESDELSTAIKLTPVTDDSDNSKGDNDRYKREDKEGYHIKDKMLYHSEWLAEGLYRLMEYAQKNNGIIESAQRLWSFLVDSTKRPYSITQAKSLLEFCADKNRSLCYKNNESQFEFPSFLNNLQADPSQYPKHHHHYVIQCPLLTQTMIDIFATKAREWALKQGTPQITMGICGFQIKYNEKCREKSEKKENDQDEQILVLGKIAETTTLHLFLSASDDSIANKHALEILGIWYDHCLKKLPDYLKNQYQPMQELSKGSQRNSRFTNSALISLKEVQGLRESQYTQFFSGILRHAYQLTDFLDYSALNVED